MNILTCHVGMGWADDAMKATAASHGLKLSDPRVLLAGHRILLGSVPVTGADLVAALPPYFAVAVEINPQGANTIELTQRLTQSWVEGTFTAWTVLRNNNVDKLVPLELRLKFEVIG